MNLNKMKKIIIPILAILVLLVAAVVTCPDKRAHKEAMMAAINEKIDEELKTDDEDVQGLSVFFGSLGSGIAGIVVDNRLVVNNHFLWSTGKIRDFDGNYQTASVGVFGHVFTFDKEDLDKAIEEAL